MRTAALLAFVLLVAGCLSPATPEGPDGPDGDPAYRDDERGITVDRPSLPREPPQPGERTTQEAPQWRLGEWWRVQVVEEFTGATYDVLRVVAGTEHGDYLVGFPIDAFSNEIMVLHVPGYGDIDRGTLAYEVHDFMFQPLRFPLVPGDSWETHWQSAATATAIVEDATETEAQVTITTSNTEIRAHYDAEIGEIRKMEIDGYATYEVIDHGYHYEGVVRVPHAHDLVFFHGRLAGALDLSQPLMPPAPAGPVERIRVGEGYDRVSFAMIFADMLGVEAGGPPLGAYSQTATAPDGAEYHAEVMAGQGSAVQIFFFEHDEPGGEWTLETVAAGAGIALFEGIGYHSIDIELPEGCVLPSRNALHHGTLCRAT